MNTELTGQQRAILTIEARQWATPGAKEQAIHDELGVSQTRYYQLLAALLDHPGAVRAEPQVVRRLREARRQRHRDRV